MKILGITGGIGTGKSEISKILIQKRAYVIDADKINHKIMMKGNLAYDEIIAVFGESILNSKAEIDRKKLAEIVFNNKKKLAKLIEINHKYVIKKTYHEIEKAKTYAKEYSFIVIDAPLLIEAGIHKVCNVVCVIHSDIAVRIERITKRDNITKQQAIARIKNQMSFEEIKKYADYVIINNNSIEALSNEVAKLLERL